ncbi:ribonuclease E/G [Thalassospira sp. TSL5-1]|uniref:ribonuclease E/G n=1 Tax=Thalassospira sp. TSL5-1 TaxID=1544451 RepID=UPI00093E7DCB|nr:ribonuclease E/G [Thalassospira sp. TSL5-1]OKH88282.1 ribonuclease E [Thalassospira sp. TSL5-1]
MQMPGRADDRLLLIDAVADERRVALLENDRVSRIWLDRGGPRRFDIHIGRISRVMPEMGAAMVVLDGSDDGLLPLDRIDGPVHEGQWVIVQVSRLGFEDKGPKLTGRIAIEGAGMILRPAGGIIDIPRKITDPQIRDHLATTLKAVALQGESVTLRTVAASWDDDALRGEFSRLRAIWHKAVGAQKNATRPVLVFQAPSDVDQLIEHHILAGGSCIVDGAAEYIRLRGVLRAHGASDAAFRAHKGESLLFDQEGVDAALEGALSPRVALPGGGWISIEATTALCAIDVNAGGAQPGQNAARRNLEVNLRAAAEIVRQVRLRNLGGLLVIDPIRMPGRAARDAFDDAIRQGFASEPGGAVQIGGFTRLGLYELSRQRSGADLASLMFEGDSAASPGTGRKLCRDAAANRVLRGLAAEMRHRPMGGVRLRLHPDILQWSTERESFRRILGDIFGAVPHCDADPALARHEYVIERL